MITHLTPELIPQTTQLVREYSKEIGFDQHFSFSDAARRLHAMQLCIVWNEGGVRGVIGGSIGFSPWNNSVRILQEEIFYVHPDYRNGTIGSRLLTTYLKNIETVDADMSTMKTMISSPASVDKLYKRFGFNETETTYVRK